jgi:hypothetical protein
MGFARQERGTSEGVDWERIMYLAFSDRSKALEFETYLKTPSGKAFIAKYFV